MNLSSGWFDDVPDSDGEITCIPSPWRFATIRMDPVAMVEDLGLRDASGFVAKARKMSPKKYLVYLDLVSTVRWSDTRF